MKHNDDMNVLKMSDTKYYMKAKSLMFVFILIFILLIMVLVLSIKMYLCSVESMSILREV